MQQLLVEMHVEVHGQLVDEGEILEDGLDAELAGVRHGSQHDLFAVQRERAGVGTVESRQHLDQCRLAGAVVADQTEHLAAPEAEVDAVQRDDRAEPLLDPLGADRIHGGRCHRPPRSAGGHEPVSRAR